MNIEYKYFTFWKLLAMNKSECCINNEFLNDRPSVIFFSSLYSADILKEASNRKGISLQSGSCENRFGDKLNGSSDAVMGVFDSIKYLNFAKNYSFNIRFNIALPKIQFKILFNSKKNLLIQFKR